MHFTYNKYIHKLTTGIENIDKASCGWVTRRKRTSEKVIISKKMYLFTHVFVHKLHQ